MDEPNQDFTSRSTSLEKEVKSSTDVEVQKEEDPTTTVPFYKLFSYADSSDMILMILGTIGAICNGLAHPLMSLLFGELIEAFEKSQRIDTVSLVFKASLKFVYIAFGSGTSAFLQVACWNVTGERQCARIRSLYLKAILQQEIAYFDQEVTTGEVIGRMSGDAILMRDAMGEKVGKFVQVVASLTGGFLIAFAKGWLLTLVLFSSIPLLIALSGIMFHYRSRAASRSQNAYDNAANVVQQTILSIRTVASFTGERQALANYKKYLSNSYKSGIDEGLYAGVGLGLFMFIMFCTYGLSVWLGTKLMLHKGYTGGQVFTVLVAVLTGSMSLGQASPCLAAFTAGQAAAFKMFETINRKPGISDYDTRGKILSGIRGDIELRDICFSYPARPREQMFVGFSMFLPSGMITALVGQSGSGKSTVISLIERFYDPQSGEVLIDGVNLKELQLKWIRSKIGLVSQEPVLFTASIKDNIAYGKDDATLDEIEHAAQLAYASDFIDKLPQGFDTLIGENGVGLSGGQKQRIAIARAIIKDPRILLLDEATSALDPDSERIVQVALEKLMINRTTMVVAHRLSTIRNANMIAVLHQGKIVEKGSHCELLENPQGVYANLIHCQEVIEDMEQFCENKNEADITIESSGESSQRISSMRSLSWSSHGAGNTSSRTMSVPETEATGNITYPETSTNLPEISIYRLAQLNKQEVPVLVVGAIFAIITGCIFPFFGLIITRVIKSFNKMPHELKKDSEFWALMLVILGVVPLVVHPSRMYLFNVAGNKMIERIRLKCFQKVVNMEIGWFDMPDNSSGVIGARLSADAAILRVLVGDALAQRVQQASAVLVAMTIAFRASWQSALIILAMIPLIGLSGYVQFKFRGDAKVSLREACQVAGDAVGNIRTVASFSTQDRIIEMYKKKCEGPVASRIKQGFISGIGFGVSICLLYLLYAASFFLGGQLLRDGQITMADVFRVFYLLTLVVIAISESALLGPNSSKAKLAATSIFSILDRRSNIDPSDECGLTLESVSGEIKLCRVNFRYPTRPGVQVLRNLSLEIHSGKIVALVGKSGSGKSTVISLLQRFYDPDSGQVTLDGIDIRSFQVKWLRQQAGVVSQDPILFNQTIRANIACGKEGNATEGEIIAAAKSANAHQFISGLQQGYDTLVGERGVQLSGGQKQRVAIARAIVKSPKILLLDEATSALDVECEKIVQEALDRVMLKRTTVVVAHRLSTIRVADEIAVLKNGSIREKGTHNTLMHIKDGIYSSLVRLHMTGLS